ncbi:MAG TPA: 4'-phosphopantetheinyl transferase superfamily protein [Acidimicrobiales bacterium]
MIGIDLVFIPEFQRLLESGGGILRREAFRESEARDQSVQHLAGLWAAKEAVIKASLAPPAKMTEIEITHDASGRPHGTIGDQHFEVSISHHGDYAIAMAMRVA